MGTHEIAFTKGAVSENQFVYEIQFSDGKVNLLGRDYNYDLYDV